MKKILSTLLAILMLSLFCISASAYDDVSHVHTEGNKQIIFNEDCQFDEKERQVIIDFLNNEDSGISTSGFNILCLFGHDYKTGTVTTVTHRVRASQPRCLQELFEVGECKRCGNTYSNLIHSSYITCCS